MKNFKQIAALLAMLALTGCAGDNAANDIKEADVLNESLLTEETDTVSDELSENVLSETGETETETEEASAYTTVFEELQEGDSETAQTNETLTENVSGDNGYTGDNSGNTDYEPETYEDGLPDYFKEILNNADTDSDGLSDGEEVNTYGTDTLKYDTDDDGISDGDEIILGLDPNNSATDGTPDGERIFEQTLDSDSKVFSHINEDGEIPFKISMDIKAAGVAENNLFVYESGYSNTVRNDAVIGIIPEFMYTNGLNVEEVTVRFELDDSIISNTLGTFAETSDEFAGIKRFNFFMYFEDINALLPIETFHDTENNIVYTVTDRLGTYCLMDMEIWLDSLGISPES